MISRSLFVLLVCLGAALVSAATYHVFKPAEPIILKSEAVFKPRYFMVAYLFGNCGSGNISLTMKDGFPQQKWLMDQIKKDLPAGLTVVIINIQELTASDYNQFYSK